MELTNAQEITRRLNILNQKKVQKVTASQLRTGGMQGRVHRRELKRFANEIASKKAKLLNQLDTINTSNIINTDSFGISSFEQSEPTIEPTLQPFNEPKLKRIRSRRGFF